jgi:hypothetical protein
MKSKLLAILLIAIIATYPLEAFLLRSLWRWQGVIFTANVLFLHILFLIVMDKGVTEGYEKKDKMEYFPWNEANLVIKRFPESTVVECGWEFVQKGGKCKERGNEFMPGNGCEPTPNFQENDVVVRPYTNLS